MQVNNIGAAYGWMKENASSGAELRLDSRNVEKGDIFIAVPGIRADGRNYMQTAAERGASLILMQKEGSDAFSAPAGVKTLAVPGLDSVLGELASRWYGEPSEAMTGFAVTGTNGKTTTSQWMASMLAELGTPCGVLGTIGCSLGEKHYSAAPLTTPDPVSLQALLASIRKDGADAFAIEASSIGLVQGRLRGTAIRYALFTNLTRDHLDYHGTMEAYEEAKTLLFCREGLRAAVVNADDPAGLRICRAALAHGVRVIAATALGTEIPEGCEKLEAANVRIGAEGVSFDLRWAGTETHVQAGVLGLFNVDNMIGAIGMMLAAGYPVERVIPVAEKLTPPAGRLQIVKREGEPMGVVDYCHTPDAIEKALTTLRPVAEVRGGKLWAIVGAGGNRDAGKRPLMGRTADQNADRLIVTSDNPRFEDPVLIAEAVAAGADHPTVIIDRAEAIRTAFAEADAADVILVAGKGHEDYQDVKGVKHHFSDVEEVAKVLSRRMHSEGKE